jgi:hypothetical protein
MKRARPTPPIGRGSPGERQCCAGFDDFAEPLAPLGFNCKIDGFASNEIRAEPNREWREPAH